MTNLYYLCFEAIDDTYYFEFKSKTAALELKSYFAETVEDDFGKFCSSPRQRRNIVKLNEDDPIESFRNWQWQ